MGAPNLSILSFQMRSRSISFFFFKSGSPARRAAPGPGQNRLKSNLCSPQNTKIEGTLGGGQEGTKLISIAKLHLEVLLLHAVKLNVLASLAQKRPRIADSLRSHTDPLNETSWLRPWTDFVRTFELIVVGIA